MKSHKYWSIGALITIDNISRNKVSAVGTEKVSK